MEAGDLISQASKQENIVLIKKSEWDDIELSHTGFVTRTFFPPEYRSVIDSAVLVFKPGKSIPAQKKPQKRPGGSLCIEGIGGVVHNDEDV